MTKSEQQPLGGFIVAARTFYVTAHELKVARGWSRAPLVGRENSLELSVAIRGTAVGEKDAVCVIGTNRRSKEFDLAIRSDDHAKDEWEWHKANDITAYQGSDTPECRVWNTRNQRLEGSPPTATLFVTDDDKELGVKGGWSLECQIPQTVLQQLVADISARRADTISIGIEWTAGLVEGRYALHGLLFSDFKTWGLFKLSEERSPEPLWGHVSLLNWTLATESANTQRPVSENLARELEKWTESFAEFRKEKVEPWMERSDLALDAVTKNIGEWCHKHADDPDRLRGMLKQAQNFLQRLDEALHQDNGPFADKKYGLWSHCDIARIYRTTTPSQREHFIDISELESLATEYLWTPWLHHPYLDWVMLDAMTAGRIVATLEPFLGQKHGIAYALFDGVSWKMALWKLIMRPIAFLSGWVLPAVVCYYIARWSLWAAIGVGVVYYGFSFWMLARWLRFKLSRLFAGKPTPLQRMAELVEQAEKVYALLAGPVMHVGTVRTAFERAAERGVTWDQRTFYILDHLAQRGPLLWETTVRSGYQPS